MHSKEKQLVLRAIEHLGPSVTPDSVSLNTGIPLLTAVRQLNTIAAETGAHLEVNSNGAISYRFSPAFATAYTFNLGKQLFSTKGLFLLRAIKVIVRMTINLIIATTKLALGILWILVRISFAILLVASIILSICAAIAAIFGDSGGGGDIGGGDWGGAFDFNFDLGHAFSDFGHCFDISHWNWCDGGGCYNTYYYDTSYSSNSSLSYSKKTDTTYNTNDSDAWRGTREMQQGDFLNDVFSFLFGDGSPNDDLDSRRLRYIGTVIQRNNGAVIAEQLAPYATRNTDNEDWMLPILVHFNGIPEVTESGTIVYLFPSLVSSNSNSMLSAKANVAQETDQLQNLVRKHLNRQTGRSTSGGTTPDYLQERPWVFSFASDGSLACILLLALANLGGSWWLYFASMHTKVLLGLHGIATVMLGFAIFMLVMPTLRWAVISVLNWRIHDRNSRRQELASAIANPDEYAYAKLDEARSLAQVLTSPASEVIFTTDKDALEQEFESMKPKENIQAGYKSSMRR